MTTTGKQLRLGRFRLPHSRHGIIVPVDHGLTIGPVDGIESSARIASWIDHGAVSGIIAHKGMIERLAAHHCLSSSVGIMMHLTGMSRLAADPDRKTRLTSMETAVRHGADAVSLQVNFDGNNDAHNLALIGAIVDDAQRYGLPVLAMVYDAVARPGTTPNKDHISRQRHLMRIAVELGVDAIKIAAPEELSDLAEILEDIIDDVAVFCAGGATRSDDALLALARQAAVHGATGMCIGRNVFQRPSPGKILDQIRAEFAAVEAIARRDHAAPVLLDGPASGAAVAGRSFAAGGLEPAVQAVGS